MTASHNTPSSETINTLAKQGPVTTLQIKEGEGFLLEVIGYDEENRIGTIQTAQVDFPHLRHEPATAHKLEAAIADIEDQLMPIISLLPNHRRLATADASFRRLERFATPGPSSSFYLDIETVEDIFNRLVDVAHGTAARRLDVPEDREFAGLVLFLRELMHHGGYDSLEQIV